MKTDFFSENEVIEYLKKGRKSLRLGVGIGDDGAVVQLKGKTVLTTDSLVENVHFKREWVTPEHLGRKAALTNLSDIAAMGALPRYCLVSLILPQACFSKKFIEGLYAGLGIEFKKYRVEIVGGNISRGSELSITLTVVGEARSEPLLRSGTRPGDLLFVTGSLGRVAAELEELLSGKMNRATYLSTSRLAFGHLLSFQKLATSCIDISDGFSLDLSRLCKASHVGVLIYANNIPAVSTLAHALHGGEEYELLFTVARSTLNKLYDAASKTRTPVSFIGEIQPKSFGLTIENSGEARETLKIAGWDHLTHS